MIAILELTLFTQLQLLEVVQTVLLEDRLCITGPILVPLVLLEDINRKRDLQIVLIVLLVLIHLDLQVIQIAIHSPQEDMLLV